MLSAGQTPPADVPTGLLAEHRRSAEIDGPSAWRITQWDGPIAHLLTTSDYDISHSMCDKATHIECIVQHSNSFSITHFPHAAEAILACWSLFRRYPTLRPRIVLKDGLSFGSSSWTLGLLRLLQCEVVSGIASTYQYGLHDIRHTCAVRGALRARHGGGFLGEEQAWLMSEGDAVALQHALGGGTGSDERAHRHTRLRVGIANRRGTRRLTNVDDLRTAVLAALRARGGADVANASSVSVIDDFGDMPFEGQARWVRGLDVLISPHGAGSVNYLFARPCTPVLEVMMRGYYIPGEYLQLVRAVGGLAFAAYEGMYAYEETARAAATFEGRMKARSANVSPNPERIARWVLDAERARERCLAQHRW